MNIFRLINSRIAFVRLSGGLGNQLYQVSNALQLKRRYKKMIIIYITLIAYEKHEYPRLKDLGLNGYVIKGFFARSLDKLLRLLRKISTDIVTIQDESTNKESTSIVWYLVGLYQVAPPKLIRRYLRMKLKLEQRNFGRSNPSLSIHLRLGDYKNTWAKENLGQLSRKYYDSVFNEFSLKSINNVQIFSDGSEEEISCFFAGIQYEIERNRTDLEDLVSIARSSIIICGNSTFALWAAYLANTKHVYVPKTFFLRDAEIQENTRSKYYKEWKIIDSEFVI